MGFYFTSTEAVDENHEAASTEAPVTGMSAGLTATLKSATIVALLEDYLKCSLMHGAFENIDAAVESVKPTLDEALNNGDMTSGDVDHVLAWVSAHRGEFSKEEHMLEKFVKHVCAEEVAEVIADNGCPECEEFARAAEIKKLCEQMGKDMFAKYGQIVTSYAADFMRLYGKNFNEQFRQKLGI